VNKVHSAESAVQLLKEYWISLEKKYNALQKYCGGIASSVMLATSTVESNFILIIWTTDCSSTFKVIYRILLGINLTLQIMQNRGESV
jgi:hypothetical protein